MHARTFTPVLAPVLKASRIVVEACPCGIVREALSVFDCGHAHGLFPHLVTLGAVVGRVLVAQKERAITTFVDAERLVDAAAVRVIAALALGDGEGGVLGGRGGGRQAVREAVLVGEAGPRVGGDGGRDVCRA